MIIVIYTPDGFWLAADSYRSRGGKHVADVCKIHQTRFGLLAKSGESQGDAGIETTYSTDKEVEDLLASAHDLASFQFELRLKFKRDIDEELAILVDDPSITWQNIEEKEMREPIPRPLVPKLTRMVILFDMRDPKGSGKILMVRPQSHEGSLLRGGHLHKFFKYWAPSVAGWHPAEDIEEEIAPGVRPTVSPSIHEFSFLTRYDKPDDWVRAHPKQALLEMLDKAHREEPESVGPPYTMVHVVQRKTKLPKVKWVAKGVCPKWTEETYKEGTLFQRRDEMRRAQP